MSKGGLYIGCRSLRHEMNNTMNHGGIDPGHEGLSSDITEVMIDEMNGSIRPHVIKSLSNVVTFSEEN